MTENLEQTSTDSAEVNNDADIPDSPNNPEIVPAYLRECLDLVQGTDIADASGIAVRCIYLLDGKVIFGLQLLETSDSFLVGAAARLTMEEGNEIIARQWVPRPIMRLSKSATIGMTNALVKYQYHYFKYLRDSGFEALPSYFQDARKTQVLDFIQTYEEANPGEVSTKVDESFNESTALKKSFERRGISGVSDNAFVPYLTSEKIH